jgi:LPXTG-motif cell wall-anchored protein
MPFLIAQSSAERDGVNVLPIIIIVLLIAAALLYWRRRG